MRLFRQPFFYPLRKAVMKIRQRIKKAHLELPMLIALMIIGFLLIHDLAGGTLLRHDPHDSYTLQAQAWLDGKTWLENGADYTWLELAVYDGQYFVSFPPVPSVVMLPFVLLFGEDTPNNALVALYTIAAVIGAYRACRSQKLSSRQSCFWAFAAVMCSNMLEISTNGGVWLQAQTLNMAFLCWAIDCALRSRRTGALLLTALAVGCRPFSAFYFPLFIVYFLYSDHSIKKTLKSLLIPLAAAALVGLAYCWYNMIRFDNPFEFGHNYLPEFTEAEHGQFHLSYLGTNLHNIFLRGVTLDENGALVFPMFDGFLFYLANPFFIILAVQFVKDLRHHRITGPMWAAVAGLAVNLICLCLHKTFGGYQFGARYTVDLLPFAFAYLLLSGRKHPHRWEVFAAAFGFLFNAYGAVLMRLYDYLPRL